MEVQSQEVAKLNQQLEQCVADLVVNRAHGQAATFPSSADGRSDRRVGNGEATRKSSPDALFCDLRGFTGFSESSDPEDVMVLPRDDHAADRRIIRYSAVERYAGDGVMVVFNDPVPVEKPALQAVLMALDVIAALTEQVASVGPRYWLWHWHRPRICYACWL